MSDPQERWSIAGRMSIQQGSAGEEEGPPHRAGRADRAGQRMTTTALTHSVPSRVASHEEVRDMRRRITALLLGVAVLGTTFIVGQQAAVAEPSKTDELHKANQHPEITWQIRVRTGNHWRAGTDAMVYFRVYGSNVPNVYPGHQYFTVSLNAARQDRINGEWLERNTTQRFDVKSFDLGHISLIEVWRGNEGFNPSWFLGSVSTWSPTRGESIYFTFNKWIEAGKWTKPEGH
jgi:hypothetical protein